MEKSAGKIKKNLDHWIQFFTHEGKEEKAMEVLLHNYPVFNKAHENYKEFTRNDELREIYEAREKWQRDQISRIKAAEKKAEERGKEIGKEIGEKIGKKIGEKDGEKKVAINLLKEGFSTEQVIKVTNFTKTEIEGFKEEINKEQSL